MLIPKKNRVAIYENLFKEGVMVAKKDFNLPNHPELEGIPNLHVIKAMQVFVPVVNLIRVIFLYTVILVTEVSRLCNGTLCLETPLLVPYK